MEQRVDRHIGRIAERAVHSACTLRDGNFSGELEESIDCDDEAYGDGRIPEPFPDLLGPEDGDCNDEEGEEMEERDVALHSLIV